MGTYTSRLIAIVARARLDGSRRIASLPARQEIQRIRLWTALRPGRRSSIPSPELKPG
ncbi:MAG: hypothetical protein MZU84_06040 [Sphingobacterium sp.]|nr:hypothetical protein [Sphingobacterium sp.]